MPHRLSKPPVYRFAPSPNGLLHLGHALSALINARFAAETGGRLLLRLEDIDRTRCRPAFEQAALDDLAWLGLTFDEPIRRQSEHFADYERALDRLRDLGLVYPAFLTRGEIRTRVAAIEAGGAPWPRDPDGAPLYPGPERDWSEAQRADAVAEATAAGRPFAWRLDMAKARNAVKGPLTWQETGLRAHGEPEDGKTVLETVHAMPEAWGDVILSRPDAPSSYHLSVTVDDALQGVTHVVRGQDLFHATSVHRLLQALLDLPEPVYHHHRLILGADGRKLSKSHRDTGLRDLREKGLSAADVRALVV
ncbi:glutamyl-Q tRNA(Asp) ligase [Rhizobium sp. Leaf384]|uniref:tRNA glutamyl-Q(34) synthetase GluQRS n=1 Tax=unclassified Rhizobium TaxID=2613769 RepID=UPI0007158D51|nr:MULTISPECIES: tRNA glutamyl-Q(34) synthetase GluQRS [unclassified Rhizobium]KQS77950.1 glutamyl-Q tRNA(Asp) ligase [Rhizobium sp. Leaf384]KQS84603.1 glutamyl-Q tRNA(Asp) ligase [Rhizobium sp. Leaf383]